MITFPFDVNNAELRKTFLAEILPDAITILDEHTQPLWGKMKAQHIVEHLRWAFELSTGKLILECRTPENLLSRVKAFLYNNKATPQNFKNLALGEDPLPFRYTSFAKAKAALMEELQNFLDYYPVHPKVIHIHPIFGPLGAEDWQRTHFKHCYHHLLQLGILREPGKEPN